MRIRTFNKEYEYVLKEDGELEKEEQTVWFYKMPNLNVQYGKNTILKFKGDVEKNKDNVETSCETESANKRADSVIMSCLLRIENLFNDNDEKVGWPTKEEIKTTVALREARENVLACIPPEARGELAEEILKTSVLSEKEIKN